MGHELVSDVVADHHDLYSRICDGLSTLSPDFTTFSSCAARFNARRVAAHGLCVHLHASSCDAVRRRIESTRVQAHRIVRSIPHHHPHRHHCQIIVHSLALVVQRSIFRRGLCVLDGHMFASLLRERDEEENARGGPPLLARGRCRTRDRGNASAARPTRATSSPRPRCRFRPVREHEAANRDRTLALDEGGEAAQALLG